VYAASKFGINGWSESLRKELLPDVRVTLIEPGVVATELPTHITHEQTRQGVQQAYDVAEVTLRTSPRPSPSPSSAPGAWSSTRSDELVEALTHIAFYAGWPSGMGASPSSRPSSRKTRSSSTKEAPTANTDRDRVPVTPEQRNPCSTSP
jgi:NAD(P)-dependent dehydrogenase (short-subunit alcohol dehydrogenase family)